MKTTVQKTENTNLIIFGAVCLLLTSLVVYFSPVV